MLLDTKVLHLTLKKAFFQVTKGHNSLIIRWRTMPFGVHHPLMHIYTHTKFKWNPPKHFQDMAPDTKVPDGRMDGRTAGWTDNAKTISIRLWRGIITYFGDWSKKVVIKKSNSIFMVKRMMHAKWHCTPSVYNRVLALCILKKCFFSVKNNTFVSRSILAGDINSTHLLFIVIISASFT